ncbi:MAG TPA: molybdate ABC transporter substrate-binding protein [Deltaproteobacteria bacterium]|nr:MAG: molybdate ABC transporter substrate-binding protein [Deltaproteobacteria bacterium GWA2_55_82]OGQ64064.1 MAG: molybdate ABC transporter substrate-binding protein [Deltaproteobacteria bacterium RIFCSPLOWO2_02_FULL_55_12]OIJ74514.1 MAG: molybdate ABC transporter substrate-binding protein [Deltaproteobacteria bacterium GWC2_55_46]HBG47177.1 molybdate ABC transporter substrate-binding protein [Deltaproteobacteria bacterium]HCY10761.1 molybdate ABC transporter substrate-binding protein [Delt
MLKKVLFIILILLVLPFKARAELRVAAAADLSFALKEIALQFEKETGNKVVLSLGSTGMLARQIEHGAPFDVFFSANSKYIDELGRGGHVLKETAGIYARGRIVLAVKKGSGIKAAHLEDLKGRTGRIAIANPDHAPYGIAAMEAMKSAGIWDDVKPRLVYGENIRQALQFVQSGNAPVGIIALSVVNVPEIEYSVIPQELHRPIDQAAAVVARSKEGRAARDFIKFVNGPKGRPIMEKYGFMLPK